MSSFNPADGRLPVITGLGVVSSIGIGVEEFWAGVTSGRAGQRPVASFDTGALRNHVGCEVDDARLAGAVRPGWAGLPRAARLAAVAAGEALAAAGLEPEEVDGLAVGTTMGDLPEIEADLGELAAAASRARIAATLSPELGARIGRAVGVPGPALTVATSCSAGNVALCRAADWIASGSRERVLAGGADAFSKLAFVGFSRMRAMAPERCDPFSRQRRGMLLGEGAAFLVLESLAAARARGARVYAALAGYGLSCDAHHVATPDPSGRGAAAAMAAALSSAGLAPEEVDYVSAHGTGTPANDLAESRACGTVFGAHRPWVSSLKALVGHALGAASALEAVAAVLSLRDQRLIPAWHVEERDPDCDVALAPAGAGDGGRPLEVVVSNAFAFGGNNSCLALRRCA